MCWRPTGFQSALTCPLDRGGHPKSGHKTAICSGRKDKVVIPRRRLADKSILDGASRNASSVVASAYGITPLKNRLTASSAAGSLAVGQVSKFLRFRMTVNIDDAANEVFFADKVIVCEGFDDFVLRAIANELSPGQLDAQNVSIIRVGGKDQISRLVKLMRRLGTQCFVVADFDYLLRDQNEACREHNARPHESLQSLGMPFFAQSCTFGARGREVFLQMQRLRT